MRKMIVLAGTFLLLCGVSGCGGESHDTVIKDTIDVLKQTARELKSIREAAKKGKDEAVSKRKKRVLDKAEKSANELRELGTKLQDLNKKALALRDTLSMDERARIGKEWNAKYKEAVEDLNKEWEALEKLKIGTQEVGKEVVASLKREGALDAFRLTKQAS